MSNSNPTVAVRIPLEVKKDLEAKAEAAGHPSLTGLLREILISHAGASDSREKPVNGRKQREALETGGRTCPLVEVLKNGRFCSYIDGPTDISEKETPANPENLHPVDQEDPFERLFRELSDECSAPDPPEGGAHMPGAEPATHDRRKVER